MSAGQQTGAKLGGRLLALDSAAILALLGLVACAFWPVYATGWLYVTVLGFGGVGIAVARLAARRGFRVGTVALLLMLAWFLFGGLLVMPSTTLVWVVPTPRTLHGLLTGPVTAWRDMLTLAPPIGETYNLLSVPGLVALLAAVWAMGSAQRGKRFWAWLPLAGAYLVAALFGAQRPFAPVAVGAAFAVVVLLWASLRRVLRGARWSPSSTRPRPLRLLGGAAVLLAAVLAAQAVAPTLTERTTLRAAVDPEVDLKQYASPLQGYRANITEHRATTLLRVTGVAPEGLIRVATLDRYDGLSFRVGSREDEALEATTFTRVGQWIADDGAEAIETVEVGVEEYRGVWVPTVGRTTSISFRGEREIGLGENFYYNAAAGTGMVSVGLAAGDTYTLTARVPTRPSDEVIAAARAGSHPLPEASGVPTEVASLARRWTLGTTTPGAAALRLEAELRQGYFSHGQVAQGEVPSLPGHNASRLAALLRDPQRMVGDHEQYAVAMALMAREVGIPARVIYGYRVSSGNVTGDDVGAWPELYFADLGWVTFDPTPPKDRVLVDEVAPQPPEPQPYVENPPPPPQRPNVPPSDEDLPTDPGEAPRPDRGINWAQLGTWFLLFGVPLLTVVVPIVLILAWKLRRRARRLGASVIANRVAGAWDELVDQARDLGRSPSATATRSEQADAMLSGFAKLPEQETIALAREADWLVFAPGEPTPEAVNRYWAAVDGLRRAMRGSVPWPRRLASWLSTRSLRRR